MLLQSSAYKYFVQLFIDLGVFVMHNKYCSNSSMLVMHSK